MSQNRAAMAVAPLHPLLGRLFWRFFLLLWLGIAGGGLLVIEGIRLLHRVDPAVLADAGVHLPRLWPALPVTLLTSAALGALLAWYVSQPIRVLTWAFQRLAAGQLDTRIAPQMARGARHKRGSEVAQLGAEFDRMAARLEGLVKAHSRLLHDVSHELRSPLARMQAAIGVARQQPARADDMLDRIERESARLDLLVGELLTLGRLESGMQQPMREPLDVIGLLVDICEDARFEARTEGRDVAFDGTGQFMVLGDRSLLQRSYENAIRNAVKFTRPGTTVHVTARLHDDRLEVDVTDAGPGVATAQLTQMFEPFQRVGQGEGNGFGLGLAIARRGVELHGGRMKALVPTCGGLTVRIELPSDSRAG